MSDLVLKLFKTTATVCITVCIGKIENIIYCRITCGIPQGSILEPLLFLVYINGLFKSSSKLTQIMFADDTNLLISKIFFETMNEELRKAATWFKATSLLEYFQNKIFFISFYKKEKIYQIFYLHRT